MIESYTIPDFGFKPLNEEVIGVLAEIEELTATLADARRHLDYVRQRCGHKIVPVGEYKNLRIEEANRKRDRDYGGGFDPSYRNPVVKVTGCQECGQLFEVTNHD